MPIFICKNCGNLTETEEKEGLTCSNCGAPLEESKTKDETKPPQDSPTPAPKPELAQTTTPPPISDEKPSAQEEADEEPSEPPVIEEPPSLESTTPQSSAESPPSTPSTLPQAPIELPKDPRPPGAHPAVAGAPSTQSHAFVESTHELMEVYENKNLVACPQCGYGCDPAWETCVICSAKIAGVQGLKKISDISFDYDEKTEEKTLIKCPKCEYACDPKWGECPICQTELKPPE